MTGRGVGAVVTALIALGMCAPAATADQAIVDLVSTGPAGGNGAYPATLFTTNWSILADRRNFPLDGARAFFQTAEPLVGSDLDDQLDVYERAGTTTNHVSTAPGAGNTPFPSANSCSARPTAAACSL